MHLDNLRLKICLYTTPSYLDTTIPLINELAKEHDVFLIIEYHGEWSVSIWETKGYTPNELFSDNQKDIEKFLGEDLLKILKRKIKVAILKYLSIKTTNPLKHISTYQLIKYLRKVKADVVDIHGPHGVLAMPFLAHMGKIFTLHDPFPHTGEYGGRGGKFHKWLGMRFADHIIVHDKKSAKLVSKIYNLPDDKITALPLGVLSIFRKWSKKEINEEKNTVLFFGRISPYKGLEYLIKAEPLIVREIPDLKIIIAGQGDFSNYEKMIQDRRRYEIYNHYITNELTARLFQRATCMVLPYTDATQSGVLMTAYAFNKPAIVTDVGGLPEVVEDGVTGFVVPPRDENSLARAIINLLKNKDLKEKIKKNISRVSKNKFSWEQIASHTIAVYKKALKVREQIKKECKAKALSKIKGQTLV